MYLCMHTYIYISPCAVRCGFPCPGRKSTAAPPREFPDLQVRLRRLPGDSAGYKVITIYSAVTKLDLPKRSLRRAPHKVPQWVRGGGGVGGSAWGEGNDA